MRAEHITEAVNVSTHSRPKAAAKDSCNWCIGTEVSTHSRPKAAEDV